MCACSTLSGMSILAVLVQCYQNVGNQMFLLRINERNSINNVFYIVFEVCQIGWTYLLNILCKGINNLLVIGLLPLVAMFILIGLVIMVLQHNHYQKQIYIIF